MANSSKRDPGSFWRRTSEPGFGSEVSGKARFIIGRYLGSEVSLKAGPFLGSVSAWKTSRKRGSFLRPEVADVVVQCDFPIGWDSDPKLDGRGVQFFEVVTGL